MTDPLTIPCSNCNGDGCIRFVNRSADPRWAGPIRCPLCHGVGRIVREGVTFDGLANMAARDLPDGWTIELTLDHGDGWVSLTDPDGREVDYASNRETIGEQLVDALQHAIDVAKDEGSKS